MGRAPRRWAQRSARLPPTGRTQEAARNSCLCERWQPLTYLLMQKKNKTAKSANLYKYNINALPTDWKKKKKSYAAADSHTKFGCGLVN